MPHENSTNQEAHPHNGAGFDPLGAISNGIPVRAGALIEGTSVAPSATHAAPPSQTNERYFGLPEALLAGVASVATLAVAYTYERAYALALGAPDILVQVDTAGVLRTLGPAFLALFIAGVLLVMAATSAMWRLLHAVAVLSIAIAALMSLVQRRWSEALVGVVIGGVLYALPWAASQARRVWRWASARWARLTAAHRMTTGLIAPWVRHSTEASTGLDRNIGGIAAVLRPGGARLAGAALITGAAMVFAINVAEYRATRRTRWPVRDGASPGRPAVALIRRYGDRVLTAPVGPNGCLVPRFSLQSVDSASAVHVGAVRSVRDCRAHMDTPTATPPTPAAAAGSQATAPAVHVP